MSESRIPLLSLDEARARARGSAVPEYVSELSVFRVLLHHPTLARRFNDLLGQLLFRATLDARLRELVIMRVGWVTGSVYEWTQHCRLEVPLEEGVEPWPPDGRTPDPEEGSEKDEEDGEEGPT